MTFRLAQGYTELYRSMREQWKSGVSENMVSMETKQRIRQASIEIYPSPTIGERVVSAFGGSGLKVNVTSSPTSGIESTLELSKFLATNGFDVVPHIGARKIADEKHLAQTMSEIHAAGIDDIFLITGEDQQAGKYKNSTQLMKELVGTGAQFSSVGIAGYPEGIEGMQDGQLIKSIKTREKLAESMGAQLSIITQMCFDERKIVQYSQYLQSNDINVPVIVGLPTPEKNGNLYKVATRCRVGDSKERLLANVSEIEYLPEELVDGIEKIDSQNLIAGYHIYTFNKINRVANWFSELANDTTVR